MATEHSSEHRNASQVAWYSDHNLKAFHDSLDVEVLGELKHPLLPVAHDVEAQMLPRPSTDCAREVLTHVRDILLHCLLPVC